MTLRLALLLPLLAGCSGADDSGPRPSPTPTPWTCAGHVLTGNGAGDHCALTADCFTEPDAPINEVRVVCDGSVGQSAFDCVCTVDAADRGSFTASTMCTPSLGTEPIVSQANAHCGFSLPPLP